MSKQTAISTSIVTATAIATAIGLVTFAGAAFAGQAQTATDATADTAFGQSFMALDTDGNGQVSWSEAKAGGISESAFHSAETTQDKALSMAEYEAAKAAKDGVVGEAVEVGEDTPAGMEMMSDDSMGAMSSGSSMEANGGMNNDATTDAQ